jgi:hypothetical protein
MLRLHLNRRNRAQASEARPLFASMFDDLTIETLNKRGFLRWD